MTKKKMTAEAVTVTKRRDVDYNYRYFLPHAPLWGDEVFCERRLDELLVFCQEARVDSVQFLVNAMPGTYYMPVRTAAEQERQAAWMKDTVAPAIRKIGVSYQLNFQMLLGAYSAGLDMRDQYVWGFLVNQHGKETLGCACPIDLDFRRIMGEMLRLWASTGPDVMWIDDDFRMHNHGLTDSELDFYCYCPQHLDLFAKQEGKRYEREELVAEMLQPGTPSMLRERWLNFLNESVNETAAWIRQQVQGVSPNTRLAQMVSAPDVHSAEGRDWRKFLGALCGDRPPIIRPCSGVYTGTSVAPKGQTITYLLMNQTINLVEQAVGSGVAEYGPELENSRFTTWCKSVKNTEYVLILGQLLGCSQVTLSMNDLDGSPLSEEPTNLNLLRDNKPRLQALADLDLRAWREAGLVVISDPDIARKVQLGENAKIQDMGSFRPWWADVLLQMGIPAFYASSQQAADDRNTVVVLDGYTAWCPSDDELKKILAGSVLLEGQAAWVLEQRGFGHLLGVRIGERAAYGLHAEIYGGGVLCGIDEEIRVPNRSLQWYKIEETGATVVSQFVDPMNRLHTGSTIFKNELGGRVAVYAGVADGINVFTCHANLRWLHGILRWLSREKFCALPIIPHHGLTMVRQQDDRTLMAFANLGTDAISNLKMRLSGTFNRLNILDKSGTWQPAEFLDQDDKAIYTLPCRLETFQWLTAMLS